MNLRVIPRLDIKGPNLVKGVHFEGLDIPELKARLAGWGVKCRPAPAGGRA